MAESEEAKESFDFFRKRCSPCNEVSKLGLVASIIEVSGTIHSLVGVSFRDGARECWMIHGSGPIEPGSIVTTLSKRGRLYLLTLEGGEYEVASANVKPADLALPNDWVSQSVPVTTRIKVGEQTGGLHRCRSCSEAFLIKEDLIEHILEEHCPNYLFKELFETFTGTMFSGFKTLAGKVRDDARWLSKLYEKRRRRFEASADRTVQAVKALEARIQAIENETKQLRAEILHIKQQARR